MPSTATVGEVVGAGRFPFVYGGDCSTLLGIVTGLRDHVGDVGLVFIDGHEDTMPLDVSEDGEAANTEIGLLLGLTGRLLTGELGDRLPRCGPNSWSMLGPRDDEWRRQFNVGTLADTRVWLAPLAEVADDPASCRTPRDRAAVGSRRPLVAAHRPRRARSRRVPERRAARRRRRTRRPHVGPAHRPRRGAVHRRRRRASAAASRSTIRTRTPTRADAAQIVAFVRNVVGTSDNKSLAQETRLAEPIDEYFTTTISA